MAERPSLLLWGLEKEQESWHSNGSHGSSAFWTHCASPQGCWRAAMEELEEPKSEQLFSAV